jgi:hypothetical protein
MGLTWRCRFRAATSPSVDKERGATFGKRGSDGSGQRLPRQILGSLDRRLRQLEEENGKLKKIVADLSLDKAMLQDVTGSTNQRGARQLATRMFLFGLFRSERMTLKGAA